MAALAAPWMVPLKAALNHGGTKRPKRDRKEAKRKQVQLATVDPATGRPSARTVAFRGFLMPCDAGGTSHEESCILTFVTDSRAEKVVHLSNPSSAFVEVCWWLDEAAVQFRIAGRAVLAEAGAEDPQLRAVREAIWGRLTPGTRETFTWPSPGMPRAKVAGEESGVVAEVEERCDGSGTGDVAPDEECGSPLSEAHFAVLLVVPDRVDELRLGGRQKRTIYTRVGPEADCAMSATAEGGGQIGRPGSALWQDEVCWLAQDVNP